MLDEIKEKKSKTCFKNYGVNNPLKIDYLVKEGMIKKHGVKYASQSVKIREKMVNNLINKYNVNNISKLDHVKNRKIKTCLKNHGVEHPGQNMLIFKIYKI